MPLQKRHRPLLRCVLSRRPAPAEGSLNVNARPGALLVSVTPHQPAMVALESRLDHSRCLVLQLLDLRCHLPDELRPVQVTTHMRLNEHSARDSVQVVQARHTSTVRCLNGCRCPVLLPCDLLELDNVLLHSQDKLHSPSVPAVCRLDQDSTQDLAGGRVYLFWVYFIG